MTIHQTLTDNEGNTYRIVSSWGLKAVTAIVVLNFVILMLIIAGLIDNVRSVEHAMDFNGRISERERAQEEILRKRTELQQWVYLEVCNMNKERAEPCLINPSVWWADPKGYPLLANDPDAQSLFGQH